MQHTEDREAQEHEYVERVDVRVEETLAAGKHLAAIMQVAADCEKHLARFHLAERRFRRAQRLGDHVSQGAERRLMEVLLYEALDHICMALQLMDFDKLRLESALDGLGLSGESSAEVVLLLRILNQRAAQLLELERESGMHIDFAEAYDEREGLTYTRFPHWQDFVPGSITQSFRDYFRSVRAAVHKRLEQHPRFWPRQTIRQYLHRRNYHALLRVLERLEVARL